MPASSKREVRKHTMVTPLPAALDPQAQALIDLMASAVKPDFDALPVPMVRTMLDESMKAFTARRISIGDSRDLLVPGPARTVPVRVYTPVRANDALLPGLVYFHGGAFIAGNLDTHDALCRLLANGSGCRIVSVAYTLAPEQTFPEPVHEALAVTRWVGAHPDHAGVDASRLAVGGDSAGGTLAAVVCQLARGDDAPPLRQQLLIYPMTEFHADTRSRRTFSRSFLLEEHALRTFGHLYLGADGDHRDPRASPLLADDLTGLPDALVVTAGFDPLRDEAIAYVNALAHAGVPSEHVGYETMCHGFLNATGVIDAALSAVEEIAESLRRSLAGG